jgi:hypothetical protein
MNFSWILCLLEKLRLSSLSHRKAFKKIGIRGVSAGIVAEYLYSPKPVIALNKKLIAKEGGIDLSKASFKRSRWLWWGGGIRLPRVRPFQKGPKESS